MRDLNYPSLFTPEQLGVDSEETKKRAAEQKIRAEFLSDDKSNRIREEIKKEFLLDKKMVITGNCLARLYKNYCNSLGIDWLSPVEHAKSLIFEEVAVGLLKEVYPDKEIIKDHNTPDLDEEIMAREEYKKGLEGKRKTIAKGRSQEDSAAVIDSSGPSVSKERYNDRLLDAAGNNRDKED